MLFFLDAMEIDKIRFEETFKRTIVMQEQQENLMSKRIQDLTNKLQVSAVSPDCEINIYRTFELFLWK